jgi:hypothetical protein
MQMFALISRSMAAEQADYRLPRQCTSVDTVSGAHWSVGGGPVMVAEARSWQFHFSVETLETNVEIGQYLSCPDLAFMRVPVHLSFNITLPFVYLKRKTNSVGRNKKKNSRVNISLNVSDIIYVGMSQFKQSRENQQKK